MKTNIALIGLFIILFNACKMPSYLPVADKIDVNKHGSYVKIFHNLYNVDGEMIIIDGELIAIDSSKIVVLTEEKKACETVAISDIKRLRLRYATPTHYGWSIPLVAVYPFIHGFASVFSIPIHLIVTTAVTISGEDAFTYNNKKMSYEKMKMFARFPNGIPQNVEMTSIK